MHQAAFQTNNTASMRPLPFLLSAAAAFASVSATSLELNAAPAGASISLPRFGPSRGLGHNNKDNWGNAVERDRRVVTIRASRNDNDDVSDDFLWAVKQANHGGLLHLQQGKTYVLGKKLDLSFLDDIYVKIDGELKACTMGIMGRPCSQPEAR